VAAALATRQHGVVARRQLLGRGVSPKAIQERLTRGAWHRLHAGVYAIGHAPLGIEARWMASVLACGPGASLSHRSAGKLWRLIPRSHAIAEVTRPRGHRSRQGILAHRAPLPGDETTVLNGIPVTSVPRTLFDLAADLKKGPLEKALNEAEVRGFTDKLSLSDLLERYPRKRGSAAIRDLLGNRKRARGVTRSELERRFLALFEATDLPPPRLNADVAVGGRFFSADCLWVEQRLIVELDGWEAHGTDMAFERDRERDRLLMTEGWRVVRVTWRQLRDDSAAVLADLGRLLRG
jgi:very-short-patch-repair endonuclease